MCCEVFLPDLRITTFPRALEALVPASASLHAAQHAAAHAAVTNASAGWHKGAADAAWAARGSAESTSSSSPAKILFKHNSTCTHRPREPPGGARDTPAPFTLSSPPRPGEPAGAGRNTGAPTSLPGDATESPAPNSHHRTWRGHRCGSHPAAPAPRTLHTFLLPETFCPPGRHPPRPLQPADALGDKSGGDRRPSLPSVLQPQPTSANRPRSSSPSPQPGHPRSGGLPQHGGHPRPPSHHHHHLRQPCLLCHPDTFASPTSPRPRAPSAPPDPGHSHHPTTPVPTALFARGCSKTGRAALPSPA